ncbi:hypothetical protein PSQ19_10545 [Devosia algicola]|uniref:Uncharacterized protein n=1 Tax=Devosia algicola TaxID=3026418 RepID=A0ABY7YJK1_9HYPH|nr:hypothetical protein [Devosia algicola]WDR01285.1 hypothetical protein PSQ19_10545 [Devosia algicola]
MSLARRRSRGDDNSSSSGSNNANQGTNNNQNGSPYGAIPNGNGLGSQPGNASLLNNNSQQAPAVNRIYDRVPDLNNGADQGGGNGIYDRIPAPANNYGTQSSTYSTLDSNASFLNAPPPDPTPTNVLLNGNGNYGQLPPPAPGQPGYNANAAPPSNYAVLPAPANQYGAAPPAAQPYGTVGGTQNFTNLGSPTGGYGRVPLQQSVTVSNAPRPSLRRGYGQTNLVPSAPRPQREQIYGAAPILQQPQRRQIYGSAPVLQPNGAASPGTSIYGALPVLQNGNINGAAANYGVAPPPAATQNGQYGAVPSGNQGPIYGAIPTGNPNGTRAFGQLQSDTQLIQPQYRFGDALPGGGVFLPPPPAAIPINQNSQVNSQPAAVGTYPLPPPLVGQQN